MASSIPSLVARLSRIARALVAGEAPRHGVVRVRAEMPDVRRGTLLTMRGPDGSPYRSIVFGAFPGEDSADPRPGTVAGRDERPGGARRIA